MNPAIFYHPEAYSISGPKLMGRNAAGESFLRGFLKFSNQKEFWIQVVEQHHANDFAHKVSTSGRKKPIRVVNKHSLNELSRSGLVFYPGPGLGEHAYNRSISKGSWSICGITHTTSSSGAMDSIVDLLISPIEPWDALICTSNAVKNNVLNLLQAQADYLRARLGITKLVLPQLPVIPLGIHTNDFNFSADQKITARDTLEISDNTLVVLFMGRLSFHAKAHPLAMYQALEMAVKHTKKDVVLIECGWHANKSIAQSFSDAAQQACPSVRVVNLDGRQALNRKLAWLCADIFCSLADNIQETFGIVPIEAMAAGLPVVVSDWDGYKDTVRDGIDGFRIPTLMPQEGLGLDLANRYALQLDSYDIYCGLSCSLISVDIQATKNAFISLFDSPELRRRMGEAGRQRAKENYDWEKIILQYEKLWSDLNQLQKFSVKEMKPLFASWPARLDPFYSFRQYPTNSLTPQTRLALVEDDLDNSLKTIQLHQKLSMVNFAKVIFPTDAEILIVLKAGFRGPRKAIDFVSEISEDRQLFVLRSLVWFVKLGILREVVS